MTEQGICKRRNIRVLVPMFGTILFVVLYFTAAFLYPGGSQADLTSKGFSWIHNYWCNLLNEKAMNGQNNTARPVAMTGMFILCISLSSFWYLFSKLAPLGNTGQRIMQFSGLLSMCTGFFLFTRHHDIIINITGLLAAFAFAVTFTGLFKMGWYKLFWLGMLNLLLIAINNFIYYTNGLLLYLPVVQKITFLFFLAWICLINIGLYYQVKKNKIQ